MRNNDLDPPRGKPQFVTAMFDDLRWFGLQCQEGPDCGGPLGPYSQSDRGPFYAAAFEKLRADGFIYPCACSRQDVLRASTAPHQAEEEPIYPGACRPKLSAECGVRSGKSESASAASQIANRKSQINRRFRVPDGAAVAFHDRGCGPQRFIAGQDFGDFVVWHHDGIPACQLAVAVDAAAMQITEVVRGADLLLSTARQILLYRALGLEPPAFFHCPLLTDDHGRRLAKRHAALSLRALRASGASPASLRRSW